MPKMLGTAALGDIQINKSVEEGLIWSKFTKVLGLGDIEPQG